MSWAFAEAARRKAEKSAASKAPKIKRRTAISKTNALIQSTSRRSSSGWRDDRAEIENAVMRAQQGRRALREANALQQKPARLFSAGSASTVSRDHYPFETLDFYVSSTIWTVKMPPRRATPSSSSKSLIVRRRQPASSTLARLGNEGFSRLNSFPI